MISLSWGVASDVGRIRKNNQDSYLADGTVFAVADGMGGHVGGEIASKLAIDTFSQAFSNKSSSLDVVDVAHDANSAILARASEEPKLSGMGTTLCLLSVSDESEDHQLNLVNVGDSRGYLFRDSELFQLTDDHTLISEMVKSGDITRDQAVVHRARHILTRALGVDSDIEVDHWKIEPKENDVFLLCSDGLTNELTDPEIAQILASPNSPDEMAKQLVDGALAAGGSDNVTCIVVRVDRTGGSSFASSDHSRIVELPSQTKLRERLQSASHSVGADVADRERFISASQVSKSRDEKAREFRASERERGSRERGRASIQAGSGVVRVNPLITSGNRSPGFTAIPTPLPKSATEKKFRLGSIFRISIFVLLLIVVLAFGVGAIGIYANHSYFVGLDGSNVAIYQGRPGGLLWYNPTLVTKTQVNEGQVFPYHIPELKKGVIETSLSSAKAYVNNLVSEASQATIATPSSPTTIAGGTTTTSVGASG